VKGTQAKVATLTPQLSPSRTAKLVDWVVSLEGIRGLDLLRGKNSPAAVAASVDDDWAQQ